MDYWFSPFRFSGNSCRVEGRAAFAASSEAALVLVPAIRTDLYQRHGSKSFGGSGFLVLVRVVNSQAPINHQIPAPPKYPMKPVKTKRHSKTMPQTIAPKASTLLSLGFICTNFLLA